MAPFFSSSPAPKESKTLHLLPFKISYSGPANIKRYFRPRASSSSNVPDSLVSSFRGRAIHGSSFSLPEGYSGLVLQPSEEKFQKKRRKSWRNSLRASIKPKLGRGNSDDHHNSNCSRDDVSSVSNNSSSTINNYELPEWRYQSIDNLATIDGSDDDQDDDDDDLPSYRRTFRPCGNFQSLMIWNPDAPADVNDDLYSRSLKEWLTLAHVVHSAS